MEIDGNDLCPCESGKKYKNCCLPKTSLGYKLDLKGKRAENFVYELSQKSFFADWCYKNPKLPNGKEICDLLIVYDDVAIIWQIKDLKLDENKKYKKSEIEKNIHQSFTARRRLFELKIPIELENPRRGKETFDPRLIKDIYLISALLGEEEDYSSFARIIKSRAIHIFTRQFTEIVLNELNTIKDFIEYLKQKESLIYSGKRILLLGGEQELLAYYLANERSFEKLTDVDFLVLQEGLWDELQKKPEWKAKKKEDIISYGWDDIINRAHLCGGEYEIVARELARLSRFERRVLSKAFFEGHVKAHNENHDIRRIAKVVGTTYCFLFMDDPEPRDRRKAMLGAICFIARGKNPDNKKVVGIATEMKMRPMCSFDFCLLEIPEWNVQAQQEMERLQRETGVFTNFTQKIVHEDEYPSRMKSNEK